MACISIPDESGCKIEAQRVAVRGWTNGEFVHLNFNAQTQLSSLSFTRMGDKYEMFLPEEQITFFALSHDYWAASAILKRQEFLIESMRAELAGLAELCRMPGINTLQDIDEHKRQLERAGVRQSEPVVPTKEDFLVKKRLFDIALKELKALVFYVVSFDLEFRVVDLIESDQNGFYFSLAIVE